MKTILITGATDGIGRATAQRLAQEGHRVVLHGRGAEKLATVAAALDGAETVQADLSRPREVAALAQEIADRFAPLDVLINNAGILKMSQPRTRDGLDIRFAVNTIAPYLLTRRLLPSLGAQARVVNLSSAAQAPVDLAALRGERALRDMDAYAQSKLALTAWSRGLAEEVGPDGPMIVSVNPGSLLGTKMVREGFGTSGNDIGIGVEILTRAALSDEFADASGRYFDNDAGGFGAPHRDALDDTKTDALMQAIDEIIKANT